MELLNLPEEVIEGKLLKFLGWNDLLRFRRVCHATKGITDGYLQVHPNRAPEIEINPKNGKSFAAFMAMGIPTTKIFLNNPFGYHFYEDSDEDLGESRRQFVAKYGTLIKHLRVVQITMWPTGKELEFLNSLVNLSSFEASHFGWGREINSQKAIQLAARAKRDWRVYKDAFPPSFKNLESIRIGENKDNELINKLKVTGEIFLHCQKLKRASLPFTWEPSLPPRTEQYANGTLMGEFYFLRIYMEPRPSNVYSEQGRLELYDFICCHDDVGGFDEWKTTALIPLHWFTSLDFMELLEKAKNTGLKFANVSPFWFYGRDAKNGRYNGKELGIPVVSMRGLHPMMMSMDMPNLEKIVIPHTSRCGVEPQHDFGDFDGVGDEIKRKSKPDWPSLKSLGINVDHFVMNAYGFEGYQELQPFTDRQMLKIESLWEQLFKDVVRGNLTELELKFEEDGKWKDYMNMKGVVPRIDDIVKSCPNLKRTKLTNWPGKNKQLLKLWEGLPKLEEVALENCREVGNVTFVGEEKEKPVFFKLQNLKKLTLTGLEKMPKITDLLFSMVLAKMNLKELVLTSDKPLEKITKEGITALLEGPFAETIEKFPFENWSMAGVSAEEFKEMGKKFRSYNMI